MTIRDLYQFHTVEILMEVAVQELQMIIKWAKQLSSFNALDVDDQINLLSEGKKLIVFSKAECRAGQKNNFRVYHLHVFILCLIIHE